MRRAASVVLALTLCGVGALVAPVGADAATSTAPICSPTPQEPSSFCATASVALTAPGSSPVTNTHDAAAPANLTLHVANTSPAHDGDGSDTVWMDHVDLNLLSGLDGGPTIAPRGLPDNLLVAGSTAGCAPNGADFSSCTAGTGTFFANVSGTQLDDGLHSGTFGIQKIVNITPPAGTTLDWRVTVDYCVTTFQLSCFGGPQQATFDIIAPFVGLTSSSSGSTIEIPTTTPSFSPFPGVTVASGAMDTLTVNVNGTSTQLDGVTAPLSKPATVVSLPTFCGAAHSVLSFTDRADAEAEATGAAPVQQVQQVLPYTISGCPTAKVAFVSADLTRATFDASASTAEVAGRSIAKYIWIFGDGTHKTTTSATTGHTYGDSADHTVSVYVVDSAGAFSVGTVHVKGSAMRFVSNKSAVVAGDPLVLSGRLHRWHSSTGLGGRRIKIQRCSRDGSHCHTVTTVITSSKASNRGAFRLTVHPTAPSAYVATFVGGNGFLGTSQAVLVYLTTAGLPHTG